MSFDLMFSTSSLAHQFIREQDATIKDMQKRPLASLSGGGDFTEAEASYEKQIEALKDDNARLKVRFFDFFLICSRTAN
jgi:hypothetical protein